MNLFYDVGFAHHVKKLNNCCSLLDKEIKNAAIKV